MTAGSGQARHGGTRAAAALVSLVVAAAVAAPSAAAAAGPAPSAPPATASVALSDPTPEEQQLREIAGAIWSPELAAGWNMNTEVAAVLSTATGEILRCSEAFSLVPRPPGFVPGLGYLVSYWKNIRDYFLAVKSNRTYRACVVTASANYRTAIELASMGI